MNDGVFVSANGSALGAGVARSYAALGSTTLGAANGATVAAAVESERPPTPVMLVPGVERSLSALQPMPGSGPSGSGPSGYGPAGYGPAGYGPAGSAAFGSGAEDRAGASSMGSASARSEFGLDPNPNSNAIANANPSPVGQIPGSGGTERADTPLAAADFRAVDRETDSIADESALAGVVQSMNDYMQSVQRDLRFTVDEDTGRTIIKVLDRENDQLIRQIPPEHLLKMAGQLLTLGELGSVGVTERA